ncbi:MAG: tetrapyrrole methylase [Alcanivorax borkumensis]|jgi:16S rRNA (cytidine1402-2'-O)-methyltransferase|uniref:Ribosomal RNA small subunit methyltransferase I n=1 Tax=Alcanivorax borkumensis (strain ATCC 700651 / DSM 11573 / NCIMB 13689 / SK2) TaxID=393595 RepID=Q0VS13_ALCBS|nr:MULTISPECIES: 16S rRNA (cytidine(1402)-2'-O)-methyltransferase [Alcanivorax]OJH07978.1 MAG: tetrapyrrole methylase [Alcanivorax borkumensis]EUC70118.1 16S rRNA methyltransferase [Alcanivorax sp. 97CO-5]PKG01900.1 16S rRNA (cytidine(1402)-2'-O)-methyltransferase [Alcanivorax sp. 97CO-6]CAL16035.1 tetrapyrrole methylase family protein, putative [Alcanivorax borkumensis SK2]BAP13455.1 tetrapyrrole methylase family protein [Alcanivorax sp. NBRC 101098]
MSGILFIVSTPIGHLDDITRRAVDVLAAVDWIAAEDTRHSQRMLDQLGIRNRMISCHDHNESQRSDELVSRLLGGEQGALISDAGTPLISDPGYRLVRACQEAGVSVVPIPGASALLAALAAAGQPSDRFLFEGFVPAKGATRQQAIARLAGLSVTSIIYEAPHRVLSFLETLKSLVEKDREITLCRELTKQFETIRRGPVAEICDWVASDSNQRRGELVLVLSPQVHSSAWTEKDEALAKTLLAELPVSRVAKILAAHTGLKRQELYVLLEEMG